ncbi:uncharacterized protein LOC143920478 [Arctopsyche grandis]|uniref:uncharacterized protein LOC143920478 n=1 Tax=Arctopsyche grandis TaxID=121162 RepID=UPI00406D8E78
MVPVPEEGANCVAVDRAYHDRPIFVDLVCNLKRSFICQKDVSVKSFRSRQVASVDCPTHKYHIFKGQFTWGDAASYCARYGMRASKTVILQLAHIVESIFALVEILATVDSHDCARILGKQLLRTRPSIENAWIGGKGQKYKWKWLHSGESIMKRGEETPKIDRTWPPFTPDVDFQKEGCLLIDRHICNKPVFIQDKCDRRKNFVCMEGVTDLTEVPNPRTKTVHKDWSKTYIVLKPMTWHNAYEECKLSGGNLPSVLVEQVITKVLLYMAEQNDILQHVWVAGKLNCEVQNEKDVCEWLDPDAHTTIEGPQENTTNCRPWCDEYNSPEYGCLNLDRENHLQGFLYGMPCNTVQNSICLLDPAHKHEKKLATEIELTKEAEDINYDESEEDHINDENDNNGTFDADYAKSGNSLDELEIAHDSLPALAESESEDVDQDESIENQHMHNDLNTTIKHENDTKTENGEEDQTHHHDDAVSKDENSTTSLNHDSLNKTDHLDKTDHLNKIDHLDKTDHLNKIDHLDKTDHLNATDADDATETHHKVTRSRGTSMGHHRNSHIKVNTRKRSS